MYEIVRIELYPFLSIYAWVIVIVAHDKGQSL